MARTPILVMCSLLPWTWKYDIGYKSWHTLWSWSTYVEILSTSNMGLRSYGPDKTWTCIQLDGQGDRQTVRVIPILLHELCRWYNFQTYMYQTKCLVRYKKHCFKTYSIIWGYRHLHGHCGEWEGLARKPG